MEVNGMPLPDGLTRYVVRLRAQDGRPMSDAHVSIRGRRADGVLVEATLDPSSELGVWEATVRLSDDIAEPRLRVDHLGRVHERLLGGADR